MRCKNAILSLLCVLLSATVAAAEPRTFTLAELEARPDLLPATIKLNRTFDFADGASAEAGRAVIPLRVEKDEVLVNAGNDLIFSIPVASSDLVQAAADSWAALTPEQQAVSTETLPNDPSLWPATVTAKAGFLFSSGAAITAGTELPVIQVDAKNVHLMDPASKKPFAALLNDTDVFERARELALLPRAERPARLPALLSKELIDADGNPVTLPEMDDSTIILLYAGASWCGPCRIFIPHLVEYLDKAIPENPNLIVVHLNVDEERSDMLQYMKDEKITWPGVPHSRMTEELQLQRFAVMYPQVTVVDRFGKILYSNFIDRIPSLPSIEAVKAAIDTGTAKKASATSP